MRILGPADMLSVATAVRDGVASTFGEVTAFGDLVRRGAVWMTRAEGVLTDAERLLARAAATLAEAETTLRGASVTVAEAAAGSLMASKALHDSQELVRRTEAVLASLESANLPARVKTVLEAVPDDKPARTPRAKRTTTPTV